MKKVILSVLAMFTAGVAHAQFSSSTTCYYYQYVETLDNGIRSNKNLGVRIVNFQNEMMGIRADNLSNVKSKLASDPDFYDNEARNNLANNWSKWNSQPTITSNATFNFGGKSNKPGVAIMKYCSSVSTSSKYTYRRYVKAAVWNYYTGSGYWASPTWDYHCYSFSTDMSQMIDWDADNPDIRHYFKRVNKDDLKPNMDFLY